MINLNNVTYRVAGRLLLENVSVSIPAGHRVGLVGKNGSGKSTLLKLISKDIQPDAGDISLTGIRGLRNSIGIVAQEVPNGDITPLEFTLAADLERNELLKQAETETLPERISDIQVRLADIGAYSAPAKASSILHGLGFNHMEQKQPLSSFSGGWRMRVAIAAVLFSEPEILLLDEPTNHLDLEATIWLESHLKSYSKTLIVVSHDKGLLNRSVNSILHLETQQLAFYKGAYNNFEKRRTERLAGLASQAKKQALNRKKIEAFVERFRAKASKAKQAQSRLKALERMAQQKIPQPEPETIFSFVNSEELFPPLIVFENVTLGYDLNAPVLNNINLRIDNGDKIGLLGRNGNGKSTLAKGIAGRLEKFFGEVNFTSKLRIGYFAQHQLDELEPELNAIEHLLKLDTEATPLKIRSRLGGVGLLQEKQTTKIKYLSGGEKARLTLAIIIYTDPHVLILDEPTNHLDINARDALVSALNDFDGAVILISHDQELLNGCVDDFFLIDDGKVARFDGDLDDYRRWLLNITGETQRRENNKNNHTGNRSLEKANRKEKRQAAAEVRNATSKLRKRAAEVEAELAKLVEKRIMIINKLGDQKTYSLSHEDLDSLFIEKGTLDKKIQQYEENWLELEEEIEQSFSELRIK
ncbi:MAG: ABC-F family ATP-binding cassette domain-containing protein [Pseudomonadota bacterium]|nr:ABC-F family ATP-binding cassette domain-containing protein [Pseudomonadota bacterium]